MQLPQMTTRRWMLAVAMAGALTGAERLGRRRAVYRELAREHGAMEHLYLGFAGTDRFPLDPGGDLCYGMTAESKAQAEHHRRQRLRYERAARRPWLPVPPDTPEPEW